MIFGKGKKETASTPSATRPLEAAAIDRWRSINQVEDSNTDSEIPESERLNSAVAPQAEAPIWPESSDSSPQDSEIMNTASSTLNESSNSDNESDFIQEHIPLINLEQVFDEEEDEISQTTFSLNESHYQTESADKEIEQTIIEDVEEMAVEEKSWDEIEVDEQEILPPPPPKERTPNGDFNLDIEEDLKNRFGTNLKSALGHGTMIEGMFSFENPVKVDGTLKGQINSNSALIVGPDAKVHAKIKVGTLIILGEVEGEIEADDLIEVRSSGLLYGDIVTRRLALEEGSIFNGNCTMIDP